MWLRSLQYAPSAAFYILALAAQVSGYTSTNAAFLLAALATALLLLPGCYHAGRWHNEKRQAKGLPRRTLEPIHLIVLGLVIAIGGVAWLAVRDTPGVNRNSTPFVVAEAPGGLALAPPVFTPRLPRFLDTVDKRKFQDVLEGLLKTSDKVEEMLATAQPFTNTRPILSNGFELANLLKALAKAKALEKEIDTELWGGGTKSVFDRNPLFSDALRNLLTDKLQQSLVDYRAALFKFERLIAPLKTVAERYPQDSELYQTAYLAGEAAADILRAPSGVLYSEMQTFKTRVVKTIQAIP